MRRLGKHAFIQRFAARGGEIAQYDDWKQGYRFTHTNSRFLLSLFCAWLKINNGEIFVFAFLLFSLHRTQWIPERNDGGVEEGGKKKKRAWNEQLSLFADLDFAKKVVCVSRVLSLLPKKEKRKCLIKFHFVLSIAGSNSDVVLLDFTFPQPLLMLLLLLPFPISQFIKHSAKKKVKLFYAYELLLFYEGCSRFAHSRSSSLSLFFPTPIRKRLLIGLWLTCDLCRFACLSSFWNIYRVEQGSL